MKQLFRNTGIAELFLSVAVLLIALTVFNLVSIAKPVGNQTCYYPATGVVTEVDDVRGIVTVEDMNGNLFEFYGDGYHVGDMCSMIMDDMDTFYYYDDIVIDVAVFGGNV